MASKGRRDCPTRKLKYQSAAAAQEALLTAKIARVLGRERRRREERVYLCPLCERWHLTSAPYRRKRNP